jgi:tryptophan halogenase
MNIIIVGGGTAGWLAALFFAKAQLGKHKVTVVESSQISIIGAGEGSTGMLTNILSNHWFKTGTSISNFLNDVDGIVKMGIVHKNWTPDGVSYFAPLDGTRTGTSSPDILFLKAFIKEGKEGMHKASEYGKLYSEGNISFNAAYHFNAFKIGAHFKKVLKDDVTVVDAVVNDVVISEKNVITKIRLNNGQELEGDLFVDCTGFKRVLMNALKVKWKSYAAHLPVDRAMPFLLPIDEDNRPKPVTVAHALSSGWMWQIPTTERIGCGYVYQSSCITPDQAQQEVERVLGRKIEPIKHINFDSGRSEVLWQSNCLVLGLAAAFTEPLEATSIHTTIVQLLTFMEYLRPDLTSTMLDVNRAYYNKKMRKLYDDTLDFLVLHYQGGREDSEFWRYIKSGKTVTPFVTDLLERCKYSVPGSLQYDYYYGSIGASLYNWILAGIDKITVEQAKAELNLYNIN